MVEKVARRLDGSKKAFLLLKGRIILIQSCLSHIPSYFLSLFRIPVLVAKRLEKLQRDFLWSGVGEGKKDDLLRWEVVCRSKEQGGLGLQKIYLKIHANIVVKWFHR